jgi:GT2 family glycosyltransferase
VAPTPASGRCNIHRDRRGCALGYKVEEIDAVGPLKAIALGPNENGIGLLVRWKGRPIGYHLRETKAGEIISPETLAEWIGKEFGTRILEEAICDELSPSLPARELPSLTVAICTRAHPDLLARCLESLKPLQAAHAFEILVVDNSPPDDATEALVRKWPSVRYTREPRPGLDFARNRAWQEATGDWIAYLDDDATVDPGWYAGLCDAWQKNPDAGAITGLVLPLELASEAQILFEKRGGFRRGFDTRRYRATLPGNSLHPAGAGIFGTGCNMAFRRSVLSELGGFDEALDTGSPLPGGGDLDMYFRVIDAGYPLVYEPACLVFHQHRKTEEALRHQYYTWGLGMMAYAGKHLKPGSPRRELFARLVRWWFRDLLRQLKSTVRGNHVLPASMLFAELWGGVVGYFGEYERSQRRIEKIKAAHP